MINGRTSRRAYKNLCIVFVLYGLYLFGFTGAFSRVATTGFSWPRSWLSMVLCGYSICSVLAFRRMRIPLAICLIIPVFYIAPQLHLLRSRLEIHAENIIGPTIYLIEVAILLIPALLLYFVAMLTRKEIATVLIGRLERPLIDKASDSTERTGKED